MKCLTQNMPRPELIIENQSMSKKKDEADINKPVHPKAVKMVEEP